MGKVFEDYFSELQTDMVEICLEYVKTERRRFIFTGLLKEGCNPVISFIR